jgi:hypothetical protein
MVSLLWRWRHGEMFDSGLEVLLDVVLVLARVRVF